MDHTLTRIPLQVRPVELSSRERQILVRIMNSDANKEIAAELGKSPATIKNQIASLMQRLDCANRTQLAVWAVRNGVTEEDA